MNWGEIISIVLGSSVITALLNIIANRRMNSAQTDSVIIGHFVNYLKVIEPRIGRVEQRLEKLETRDGIYDRATANAYRCKYSEDCPVLQFLEKHPLPSKLTLYDEDNDNGRC